MKNFNILEAAILNIEIEKDPQATDTLKEN